jgi:hypothetical protein
MLSLIKTAAIGDDVRIVGGKHLEDSDNKAIYYKRRELL